MSKCIIQCVARMLLMVCCMLCLAVQLPIDFSHIAWRHQMETFSALLALCVGNSPVNSPHKGQWRGALIYSLVYPWINGWVNNHEAGDLRRYSGHYDVSVMNMLCGITDWFNSYISSFLTKHFAWNMSCVKPRYITSVIRTPTFTW